MGRMKAAIIVGLSMLMLLAMQVDALAGRALRL